MRPSCLICSSPSSPSTAKATPLSRRSGRRSALSLQGSPEGVELPSAAAEALFVLKEGFLLLCSYFHLNSRDFPPLSREDGHSLCDNCRPLISDLIQLEMKRAEIEGKIQRTLKRVKEKARKERENDKVKGGGWEDLGFALREKIRCQEYKVEVKLERLAVPDATTAIRKFEELPSQSQSGAVVRLEPVKEERGERQSRGTPKVLSSEAATATPSSETRKQEEEECCQGEEDYLDDNDFEPSFPPCDEEEDFPPQGQDLRNKTDEDETKTDNNNIGIMTTNRKPNPKRPRTRRKPRATIQRRRRRQPLPQEENEELESTSGTRTSARVLRGRVAKASLEKAMKQQREQVKKLPKGLALQDLVKKTLLRIPPVNNEEEKTEGRDGQVQGQVGSGGDTDFQLELVRIKEEQIDLDQDHDTEDFAGGEISPNPDQDPDFIFGLGPTEEDQDQGQEGQGAAVDNNDLDWIPSDEEEDIDNEELDEDFFPTKKMRRNSTRNMVTATPTLKKAKRDPSVIKPPRPRFTAKDRKNNPDASDYWSRFWSKKKKNKDKKLQGSRVVTSLPNGDFTYMNIEFSQVPYEEGRSFRCHKCGQVVSGTFKQMKDNHETEFSRITMHIRAIHYNAYACKLCSRPFTTSKNLRAHMRCHKTEMEPYICPICGRPLRVWKPHAIKQHLWTHMSKEEQEDAIKNGENPPRIRLNQRKGSGKYLCDECPQTFPWPKDLHEHKVNAHSQQNAVSEPEPLPANSFETAAAPEPELQIDLSEKVAECTKQYRDYFYTEVETSSNFVLQCQTCLFRVVKDRMDYRGAAYDQMHRHFKSTHLKENKCSLCGKVCPDAVRLGRHLNTIHRQKRECETCGRQFAVRNQRAKDRYSRHLWSHYSEEEKRERREKGEEEPPPSSPHPSRGNFMCEACGRSFSFKSSLERHIILVHEKEDRRRRHECVCGKYYCKPESLEEHLGVCQKAIALTMRIEELGEAERVVSESLL